MWRALLQLQASWCSGLTRPAMRGMLVHKHKRVQSLHMDACQGVKAAEACAVALRGSWVCVGIMSCYAPTGEEGVGVQGLYCAACMWRWGEGVGMLCRSPLTLWVWRVLVGLHACSVVC